MPLFIYTAIDQNGRRRMGEIQAPDKAAALSVVEKQNLTPLAIEPKSGGAAEIYKWGLSFNVFGGLSAVDKILLTKHLGAVVKAGLSLREALEILWEDAKKPALKRVLFDAKTNLERGRPLSAVFESYPGYFSPIFVGLIKAGEKSGTLENALNNLGNQLARDYELLKKVKTAMIYPSILLATSAGVVLLLLTFLLPRLAKVFEASKAELPLITRFFVRLGEIFSWNPFITVGIFLLFTVGFIFLFRSPKGRAAAVFYLQRLPMADKIIKELALARLTETFNNLLKSGVGALEAMEIVAQTVGNKDYGEALFSIRENIKKGGGLADSFRKNEKLFPRLFVSMIAVGERTGTLEKSLETLSAFYNEEVDRSLKNIVSLLEPVLLIVMGVVVGGIALSVILPIYQLVGRVR